MAQEYKRREKSEGYVRELKGCRWVWGGDRMLSRRGARKTLAL